MKMEEPIKIRPLSEVHIDEILKLWEKAGLSIRPNGRDSKATLGEQICDSHCLFLGAFRGGILVGMILANHEGRKGWLNRLAVDPSARRSGIALRLIKEAEKWFAEFGIRIHAALIEDWNEPSLKLLQKAGFVEHRDIIYFSKRESPEI